VERLLSDNSKARDRLGWVPEFDGLPGLERGLRETIDWFSDPANLARYPRSGYVV
jgi:dTDP-glucose 4,6-dehydratase/UDP-glucose 4-epimerase